MSRPSEKQLREQIERLIERDFGSVDSDLVSRILRTMSGQFSAREVSAASEVETSSPDESDQAEVSIVATEDAQVRELTRTILDVGALMIEVDAPVELNEIVRLVIDLVPAAFSMRLSGRVVNLSSSGAAIEIVRVDPEDRVALARLRDWSSTPRPEPSPGRITARRVVSITSPDEAVLVTSTHAGEALDTAIEQTGEFYGPSLRWVDALGDPERVEDLSGDRILDILLQLSEAAFNGVVELEQREGSEDVHWQIFFDSGYLVDATRRPRSARVELGHMLRLAGRVEEDGLGMAAADAEERGVSLERSLFDLEVLAPDALRHALAGRLTFVLRLLCNTDRGQLSVYGAGALPVGIMPAPPLRVHVAIERTVFALLFERFKQQSYKERDRMVAPDLDTYPEVPEAERERLERSVVDPTFLDAAVRLANAGRRMREVITESPLPGDDTISLLFALHRMGIVRFDRSLHHTVVRERYRENVTVKYLSVHKASYFEVLNVHWSSYDEVVRRAYEGLRDQFDPQTVPEHLEAQVHQRVAEIRERVESAYQVLSRRKHRHAYRQRIMPDYKIAHAIPLFLKQSELAERRDQWGEARDGLRRVLELDPDHRVGVDRLRMIEAVIARGGIEADPKSTI